MRFISSLCLSVEIMLCVVFGTKAVSLDGSCTETSQCVGSGLMICRNGKCQCDSPWYTPCGTSTCNLKSSFVYEGQECRDDQNCLSNAVCNQNKRCQCILGYTAINGLCYKSLNSTCLQSSECWSRECRGNTCKCPLGAIPRGDNSRCQRTLARLYSSWTEANVSNDFCYQSNASDCLDLNAVCKNDSQHTERFCQCPSNYTADYVNQICRLREYSGKLSPSMTPLPYEECGTCKDENALCTKADNQTTCWCRSGFVNRNDLCVKSNVVLIFPDDEDIKQHKYASPYCSSPGDNTSVIVNNNLCVCKNGYEFVDKSSSCRPIKAIWENNAFEYGVCTRINSQGKAKEEMGLCPLPLRCEQRQDKHVCSCGRDKYWNEVNNTCRHFLGRDLKYADRSSCPHGSDLVNNTQCQCTPIGLYRTSSDNTQCELNLSNNQGDSDCAINATFDTYCENLFGVNARFCRVGECRCTNNRSYYQNGGCVTLLHIDTKSNANCSTNAEFVGAQCKCKDGYRATDGNRTCERKVDQLYNPEDALPSTSYSDVSTQDCKALFYNGPVVSNRNVCQCVNGTFSIDNACVLSLLNPQAPSDVMPPCPVNSQWDNVKGCDCIAGYRPQDDKRACVRSTTTVYVLDEVNNEDTPDLTDIGCINLFGYAAQISQNGRYCICLNAELAFWKENRCYFLVDTPQTTFTTQDACPLPSIVGENICNCPLGYKATESKQECIPKSVYANNLQSIDINKFTIQCNVENTNDSDCEALHGTGAVCRNSTCYCDQSRSYVRGSRCELFSNYVFPGLHERHTFTCNTQDDCGVDSDKNGIECGYINNVTDYRVCKCKRGYLLNPLESTCVKARCSRDCSNTEECQGYECKCKAGYYRNTDGECAITEPLKLHVQCNATFWSQVTSTDDAIQCSSACLRAACIVGYYDDGSSCVKNKFDSYCVHDVNLCKRLSVNSQCYLDENKCVCSSGFYRTESDIICAQPVNGPCLQHEDCGSFGQCLNARCKCIAYAKEQQVSDFQGRQVTRCVNGVDPKRFNPILFFLFLIIELIII